MDIAQNGIPLLMPKLPLTKLIIPYLEKIDKSKQYSNRGPLVRKLEDRYSSMFGVDSNRVVILANATLAIQGLVNILEVSTFKVPDFTFAATGQAVLNSKKNLKLVDIDTVTWQIIAPKFNSEPMTGHIPVMPFGAPIPLENWTSIPNVIFDAAASIGCIYPDFSLLNETSAVVFSLHATKVGGCGEGAVVICGSSEMSEQLLKWQNFGFSEDRISVIEGTNAKMSEYQAAVGNAVLDTWRFELNEWRLSNTAASDFSREFGFASITASYEGVTPYWIVKFKDKKTRDRVSNHLQSKAIQCRNWWTMPLSKMPIFHDESVEDLNTNALHASETSLGLPMYRGLEFETIEFIACEVLTAINSSE